MSKFAIVLCASIFFASTLVECEKTLDGAELQLRVHTAWTSIEDRLHRIRDEIYSLGAQPSQINYEIVQNLKENVTNHMRKIRNLVMRLSVKLQLGVQNKAECMRHYDEYEALAISVVTKLDNCVSSVVLSTFESFGKIMTAAAQCVKRIKGIEDWAPQCEGFQCDLVNTSVALITSNALQSLEEALDDYKKLADGSSVREIVRTETDYNHFIESEDAFWNKLLECLTTSASSTTPAA